MARDSSNTWQFNAIQSLSSLAFFDAAVPRALARSKSALVKNSASAMAAVRPLLAGLREPRASFAEHFHIFSYIFNIFSSIFQGVFAVRDLFRDLFGLFGLFSA